MHNINFKFLSSSVVLNFLYDHQKNKKQNVAKRLRKSAGVWVALSLSPIFGGPDQISVRPTEKWARV